MQRLKISCAPQPSGFRDGFHHSCSGDGKERENPEVLTDFLNNICYKIKSKRQERHNTYVGLCRIVPTSPPYVSVRPLQSVENLC